MAWVCYILQYYVISLHSKRLLRYLCVNKARELPDKKHSVPCETFALIAVKKLNKFTAIARSATKAQRTLSRALLFLLLSSTEVTHNIQIVSVTSVSAKIQSNLHFSHLLQQAEPSSGCAQQSPPSSSADSPGIQQADPLEGCAQHAALDFRVSFCKPLLFCNTGMFKIVFSIICNV